MSICIIAAIARNRVIGSRGALPWHLPADLARFKALTVGHALVMGRRTFDSLGRPLPGRRNVVISRRHDLHIPGAEVVGSLGSALARVADEPEVFIAGGAEIYALALPIADRLELTVIDADFEGDVYFPEFDESAWDLVHEQHHGADERHAWAFAFMSYESRRHDGTKARIAPIPHPPP